MIHSTELIKFPVVLFNTTTKHKMIAVSIDNMWLTGKSLDNLQDKAYGEISDYLVDDFCLYIGMLNDKEEEVLENIINYMNIDKQNT